MVSLFFFPPLSAVSGCLYMSLSSVLVSFSLLPASAPWCQSFVLLCSVKQVHFFTFPGSYSCFTFPLCSRYLQLFLIWVTTVLHCFCVCSISGSHFLKVVVMSAMLAHDLSYWVTNAHTANLEKFKFKCTSIWMVNKIPIGTVLNHTPL